MEQTFGDAGVLKGILPNASVRRPRRVDGERRCAHETCDTLLSVYNTRPLCWVHDPGRPFYLRVRTKAEG